MKRTIYRVVSWKATDMGRFIDFWAGAYQDPREDLYTGNIGELTRGAVKDLYAWKRGHDEFGQIPRRQRESIERNFLSRLPELKRLPRNRNPEDVLRLFSKGGAIYRIFFLHIWQPRKYPIYDQNVHRAMCFIKHAPLGELPATDKARVKTYLEEYVPFYNLFPARPHRKVDKALWSFGRFMASSIVDLGNLNREKGEGKCHRGR